jgi:hypothetical protein
LGKKRNNEEKKQKESVFSKKKHKPLFGGQRKLKVSAQTREQWAADPAPLEDSHEP